MCIFYKTHMSPPTHTHTHTHTQFLSLILRFECVRGPWVFRAGVETGLADCSGCTPFSISPGGLCFPSPMLHCTLRWALPLDSYPSMLRTSRLPYGQAGCTGRPSPGCCGRGKQHSRAGGPPLGGSAGAELEPGGVDRPLVTTGLVRDTRAAGRAQPDFPARLPHPRLLTISCTPQQPLSK